LRKKNEKRKNEKNLSFKGGLSGLPTLDKNQAEWSIFMQLGIRRAEKSGEMLLKNQRPVNFAEYLKSEICKIDFGDWDFLPAQLSCFIY